MTWMDFQRIMLSRKSQTQKVTFGTSLAVQWLRLHAPSAGGMGSIPDQGTKIPHATWPKKRLHLVQFICITLLK